jgi:hypothetical protein
LFYLLSHFNNKIMEIYKKYILKIILNNILKLFLWRWIEGLSTSLGSSRLFRIQRRELRKRGFFGGMCSKFV